MWRMFLHVVLKLNRSAFNRSKPKLSELNTELPPIYGTRKFITAFTKA